ncbi:MAG TPA: DUF1569 domain-containing protein [Thermoanaerobaculia bacterium]|jgi:hypothetical protein
MMKTLFDPADRSALEGRIRALGPDNRRLWGKMSAAQAMCHCGRPLETAIGEKPMKQAFIGKIIMPFIRKTIFSEKPFGKSAPTDPTFVVADERELNAERDQLLTLIDRFVQRGPDAARKETHSFFGKLSGAEWGQLMYKHIDHHLQQFGA